MNSELQRVKRRADAARKATASRDDAIRRARANGATLKDIAAVAGVSFQRVHQITR